MGISTLLGLLPRRRHQLLSFSVFETLARYKSKASSLFFFWGPGIVPKCSPPVPVITLKPDLRLMFLSLPNDPHQSRPPNILYQTFFPSLTCAPNHTFRRSVRSELCVCRSRKRDATTRVLLRMEDDQRARFCYHLASSRGPLV